ncbi:MAG: peptidylprolyl isomerase, partial [Candidatus Omnitrophica bacterium]|nr:peptidylprolyl isomerase [Candidatus Omnitrophota bacterium]
NRTSLNPPSKLPENIIARIGKREIAQSEIDTAIENVPQWMRGALATDEGKLKFIRQYVAGEILYDKAKRLGFDRNPRIIEAVNDYKKNVTVQALMQKEVEQSLKIDADDLVLYYKANKEKYVVPEKIKVSYLESGDKDKKEDIVASLKAGKGRKSDQWIEKNFTFIPDIGEVKDVVSGLFKLDKGSCSEPTKINDKTYIFLIEDKQPEKQLSFEEVKSQVEGEYKNKKQQEIISSLVDKSLEQQEVEILFKPNKENGNQKK